MDHYELLGVKRGATRKEIKNAYKALAAKTHPDKGGDAGTHQALTVAYNVLSDDRRRSRYDETGEQSQGAPADRSEVLVVALFDILIDQGFVGNIINEARGRLISSSMAQQTQISKGTQLVKAYRSKLGRIISKEGTSNFYEALVLRNIEHLERQLIADNEEKEALTKALVLIDNYADTKPEEQHGPSTAGAKYNHTWGRG